MQYNNTCPGFYLDFTIRGQARAEVRLVRSSGGGAGAQRRVQERSLLGGERPERRFAFSLIGKSLLENRKPERSHKAT